MQNITKKMLIILVTAVSVESYAAKDKDQMWVCASDDAIPGIFVQLPERGIPKVQVGGVNHSSDFEHEGPDEDGDGDFLRFNFDNNNQSVRLNLKNYKSAETKNLYRAGYYDFSKVGEGEMASAIQYVCVEILYK